MINDGHKEWKKTAQGRSGKEKLWPKVWCMSNACTSPLGVNHTTTWYADQPNEPLRMFGIWGELLALLLRRLVCFLPFYMIGHIYFVLYAQ